MRIGLLGGSFSPVHIGHLAIGAEVKDFAHLDQVLYLPVGVHAEKIKLLPQKHRVKMLELAIKDNPNFGVCYYEVEKETYSYTYETLKSLAVMHPDWEIFFIIGSDILAHIPRVWYCGQQLLAEFKFLIICRDSEKQIVDLIDQDPLLKAVQENLILVPMQFYFHLSSTLIRKRIRQGQTIRYLVPRLVEEYIYTHHLYQDDNKEDDKDN